MANLRRRGDLSTETIFNMVKVALFILVVLALIGGAAVMLFKPDLLPWG